MHTYLRMLGMIRPYLTQVVFSVLMMVCFSLLSTTSIWMISPFLGTLFSVETPIGQEMGLGDAFQPGATPSTEEASQASGVAENLRSRFDVLKDWRDAFKERLDSYLLQGSRKEALFRIVIIFFFLFLAKNVTGYLQTVSMAYVGQRVIQDLRDALFLKFTTLPLGFFHRHRAGELISRATNDVQIANKCINVSFSNMVRDPILIVMYLSFALLISWRLTLVAMVVLPLSMLIIIRIGKKLRKYSHRQQEKLANLTSVLQETVYGIRVIKAFAMEPVENRKFLHESERLFHDMFKIHFIQKLSSPLTEQLSVLVGLFILWYGGSQVIDAQQLPPDLFILFLISVFSTVQPIKQLSQVNNHVQEGMAAAERVFDVLDTAPESPPGEDEIELERCEGRVEFEHVSFSYDEVSPVLRDIDLKVQPGEIVALVGSSGAGKSTLVDLIPRFYEPDAGRILIDGIDLSTIRRDSLRRAVGMVTQEVILFNATVRENIAYGLEDVDDETVIEAARAANAHRFIVELPQGYDTPIGDRGVRLSGGERQRISIARAILKNPPILILDEATSALDTESELLVQQAIDRLVSSRTTFVIAHRLSTIQNVDRIYVLQEGRIEQMGSHDELLGRGGRYRELYDLQFR